MDKTQSAIRVGTVLGAMTVLLFVGLATADEGADASWSDLIHPEHQASIVEADDRAAAVNAAVKPQYQDALADLDQVRQLLAAKALPAPLDELTGTWRCRSVQINNLGVFAYPFFRCRIVGDASALHFDKLNGSQRRSGRLFPAAGDTRVFLGGATVNDDPRKSYSALENPAAAARESDSVGVLRKIGDHHLLMILDAKPESYEVYELKR